MVACTECSLVVYSSIDNLAPVVKDLLVLGKFSRQIVIKKLDSIDN